MSRPWRPKPFLQLVGPVSGFQSAALRVAPLAKTGGLIVIGGAAHADLILEQLAAIGVAAHVLLEPEPRDTAAAVAVAAAWVGRIDPAAIVAVFAADHHIPDAGAFRAAVGACLARARTGGIVTLGIRPTRAATAYGYIRPASGEGAVRAIAGFEEKPDAARATLLVEAGALWNSGTFVATAATLSGELRRWATPIADAAGRAVAQAEPGEGVVRLGQALADAPRLAFDRAVMEKTEVGAVLPVDLAWSDLGSWDAVLAASDTDPQGSSLSPGVKVSGARDVLVRAGAGLQVSVLGASRLAIVADGDGVLVCNLDEAQSVRPPGGGAGRALCFNDLRTAGDAYRMWLGTAALPLWATIGTDPASGGFREALTWDGQVVDPHRRTRVQARQAFVFASAAADGLAGPWDSVARTGHAALVAQAQRPDGLFASIVDLNGALIDATPRLYEHAFVLLALAALHRLEPEAGHGEAAAALRARLQAFRHPAGGFREAGAEPFQANAAMHLFEAALEWEAAGGDTGWSDLADDLAGLALTRFIDPATGALSEFFDAAWSRRTGEAGLLEPGHQFEWAWLLARWSRLRKDPRGEAAARRLFDVGRRGLDHERGVIVNALWDDFSVRDAGARLWPQTEHLKAALILGDPDAALQAANGLWAYLDTPARGVWRERMRPDGGFVPEPSPATSLYHLYLAIRELGAGAETVIVGGPWS